jgi:hypothetical protein
MVADHEIVAADRLEAIAIVETAGAVIVDIDGEVELLEAAFACLGDRPFG